MSRLGKLAGVSCWIWIAAVSASPLDGIVCGKGCSAPDGYRAPIVSNGELNMAVDFLCGTPEKNCYQYSTGIWWEGRRQGGHCYPLISQGGFRTVISIDGTQKKTPETWEQKLDIHSASITCRKTYAGGLHVEGTVFVPFEKNVIALRQVVTNTSAVPHDVTVGIAYMRTVNAWTAGAWASDPEPGTLRYDMRSFGRRVWDTSVTVFGAGSGTPVLSVPKPDADVACLSQTFRLAPGAAQTLDGFILFVDSCEDTIKTGRGLAGKRPKTDIAKERTEGRAALLKRGFDGLFAAHRAAWAAYYAESSVRFPDPVFQRLADMAAYHLRCNATKWSFPTGIFGSHWDGRYFGFDEMFCQQGLVSANHLDTSRRTCDYRKATLPTAVYRNSHYGRPGKYGARWVWECEEDGTDEGTPQGFWIEHIFHMSNIGKSCWMQYLYSDDRDFLEKTGYPVMLECARYFRNCATYEDSDGDTYIGKFTDIERLGPARDHPFLTTCGAIYSMETAAAASELLGTNLTEAADFRTTAAKLRKGLPQRNGRYVGFRGCEEESVVTLGGYFPYPIIPSSDPVQRKAVKHFFANGRASGNMYPRGKKICPWYAGWMSAAASYMEDRAEAPRWLAEAASVAGLFGEYFEINEPGSLFHPWFSTAAGNCLFALNQLLVCDADDETRLAFTIPETWKDYAFRLPCQKGVMIDLDVKNGVLTRLILTPQTAGAEKTLTLVLREALAKGVDVGNPAILKTIRGNDRVTFTIRVKGSVSLVR